MATVERVPATRIQQLDCMCYAFVIFFVNKYSFYLSQKHGNFSFMIMEKGKQKRMEFRISQKTKEHYRFSNSAKKKKYGF